MGAWPRVPSMEREGCGAREALAAAAVVTPGRGNPRGLRRRWASGAVLALGSGLVECYPRTLREGLGCVCVFSPPPGPSPGNMGRGVPIIGPTTARACAFRWLLNLRACRILFWNLASSLLAAQRQGWEDSSGQQRGLSLWTSGSTCRVALCRPRRERSSVPELYFKDPPIPFRLSSYSPSVYCPLVPFVPVPTTWLEEIAESGRNKSFNTTLKSHQLTQTSQRDNSCEA